MAAETDRRFKMSDFPHRMTVTCHDKQACEFEGELYDRFGHLGCQKHELPYPLHGETIDVGCCRRMLLTLLPLLPPSSCPSSYEDEVKMTWLEEECERKKDS